MPATYAQRFQELLSSADDIGLCDGVDDLGIELFGNTADAKREPEPLKTVMLVWHTLGIIGNGGFRYLFEYDYPGDPDYSRIAAAYRNAGATEAHECVLKAINKFPQNPFPVAVDDRRRILDSFGEDDLNDVDFPYFKMLNSNVIERRLAAFIRAHATEFIWLFEMHTDT